MLSILGVPEPGSDVTVLITRININPFGHLLEFWGNFRPERRGEYISLEKVIQSPRNVFREFEGNNGDQCLVRSEDTWYRSHIVSRDGSNYTVYLIDKGFTLTATTNMMAWGEKGYFHLPPEVEYCVLSNVVPLRHNDKWSPMAIEFIKSLCGKSVKSLVQDVLVTNRVILLHVPSISQQMYEMGFARKLTSDKFKEYVVNALQAHSRTVVCPLSQSDSTVNVPQETDEKEQYFIFPELSVGAVETVIITEVTNPLRVFCQLKVFSEEMRKLSERITQYYESSLAFSPPCPKVLGSPCASKGSDGRWYRSVLHQVLPVNNMVEVLNIDYGKKQFVRVENVRQLTKEFFRMPVVTYICSLHGIIDKGVGWTAAQIEKLKSLLLNRSLTAKFEFRSLSEGVHYVTLFREGNVNINNLFGVTERCLLESENSAGENAVCHTLSRCQNSIQQESQRNGSTPTQATGDMGRKQMTENSLKEDLLIHSWHAAVVQYVCSPSEFWIQRQKYMKEFDELMDNMSDFYRSSLSHTERSPTVSLYCAAKAQDGAFYRATVSEVSEDQLKVFFVDYGNSELIDKSDIRVLPVNFRVLPQLALKCRLAGVKPIDETWSDNAIDFFTRAVFSKALTVHVTARCDDDFYVVQLTFSSTEGKGDVGDLMCRFGHAHKDVVQETVKSKMIMPPAVIPLAVNSSVTHFDGYNNSVNTSHTPNTGDTSAYQSRGAVLKELLFPIGSTLDVNVSYIESPCNFWCQPEKTAPDLRLLMNDMQTYYADSHFEPSMEMVCVARHPDNGRWHRALIIGKRVTSHAEVMLVDLGQTKTVPLHDLRKMHPPFLELKGQAFRCSLYNPADPKSTMTEWDKEATAKFQEFVDNAKANRIHLKCTIYAVMYNVEKFLFNVVNLETPFENVCSRIVHLGKSTLKIDSGPSPHQDTYFYSTHNIKTGIEEMVTVTCVNNTSSFFCQLQRNVDVMQDLMKKLNTLRHPLRRDGLAIALKSTCLAKYTDGCWYRGQIKAVKPSVLVHFVDYGDTLKVDESDLLPVPREASEIMAVPVQAVQCGLCDIPADVPDEVNSCFESNVISKAFRALVVAKEPDGRLLVELYDGKTQVNSMLKKMFCRKEQEIYPPRGTLKYPTSHTQRALKTSPKPATEMKDVGPPPRTCHRPAARPADRNDQSARAAASAFHGTPHHRQSSAQRPSDVVKSHSPATAHTNQVKEKAFTEPQKPPTSHLACKESWETSNLDHEPKFEILPKITELPSKTITPGMEAHVFVSYCDSLLSFYVQLVSDEDDIFSILEKLNDGQPTSEAIDIKDLHPHDLVQAEYTEDSSWYRAVVRETHGNRTATVEFVDFGNAAVVSPPNIRRLDQAFLQFPRYSTHCLLSHAAAAGKDQPLDPNVVSAFKDYVGQDGDKKLKCRFIKQSGSVWEVSFEDWDVSVSSAKAPTDLTALPQRPEQEEEKPGQGSSSRESPCEVSKTDAPPLRYDKLSLSKGEHLEAYITAMHGPWSFWCQSADTTQLDKVIEMVSEAVTAVEDVPFPANSLLPGSPCLALFADDGQWYRAEVTGKDGQMLAVLFVDYGNESQVCVQDVRKITPALAKTPPQAFLCELEGFEASHGLRSDDATDETLELFMDKLLQLTVERVSSNGEGETKHFVKVECEGQLLNDMLKPPCKASPTESEPDTTGLLTSTSYDSTLNKEAVPLMPLTTSPQSPINQDIDAPVALIEPGALLSDLGEEQQACFEPHDELVISSTTDEASALTVDLKNSDEHTGSTESESFADGQLEEKAEILSEWTDTDKPLNLTEISSLRELACNQVSRNVPTIVISEAQSISREVIQPQSDICDGRTNKKSGESNTEKNMAETVETQQVVPCDSCSHPCSDKEPEEALFPSMNKVQKIPEQHFQLSEAVPNCAECLTTTSDKYADQDFTPVITEMEFHSEDLATDMEDKLDLTPEVDELAEQEAETEVAAIQEEAPSTPNHQEDESEEVTSLTHEASSAEVCIETREAELVVSEQPVDTAPSQDMDLKEYVSEEESYYFAEDGFGVSSVKENGRHL